MEFIKQTLNLINTKDDTLYDFIYNLVFFMHYKKSEDDVKNGKVMTIEELKQHIDELEAKYANNNS